MGQAQISKDFYEARNFDDDQPVQLTINDILYSVPVSMLPNTTLNSFIRNVANLKGTKIMCNEGGCGACIVAAEVKGKVISVNSCLVSVFICNGWKITTIEGIGNCKNGYHTLQATLAEMNGSQCGFCSPGWVMQMFSLTRPCEMTMTEIENSFASNLCRCTGYRPILDTFKSFASDTPSMMKHKIEDIEDLYGIKSCENCRKKTCFGTCQDIEIICKSSIPRSFMIETAQSVKFFKVLNIEDIFKIFTKFSNVPHLINGGNTAHGVYRQNLLPINIDVNDVPDLHRIQTDENALVLGANVSLTIAKICFEENMKKTGFEYLETMAKHIDRVASIPVRNIGTIAGNLMIKHQHPEFPSDIFLILEAALTEIHILNSPSSKSSMTLREFLNVNMDNKLIYSIVLRSLSKDFVYKTYKIMPRAQNAHAIVNAGFLFKFYKDGTVMERPNIIFGGIRPNFIHAVKTEQFLTGKTIFDEKTAKTALKTLNSEINPDYVLPDFKPEFRKLLAVSLFYKFVLSINSNRINSKLQSGGTVLNRGLSSGKQNYDTDRNLWPDNQPTPKIGAIYQTSGEAEYINDIPMRQNEVFCVLTLAERTGKIAKIDYESAMKISGVIAFYCAKDIPGKNLFIYGKYKYILSDEDEILFADNEVMYAGQPFGVIVATSQSIAQYAASKVDIVFSPGMRRKPLITIHDVLVSNDKTRIKKVIDYPAQQPAGKDIKHTIKGIYECGSQYHFTMETQTCVCVPNEDEMDVFSATQYMDFAQSSIAMVLNVPINSINMKVRRLGGAYGAKISRSSIIACACALACHLLNRPARIVMSIEDNMRSMGKRFPGYMEYEVSVDDSGKIQKMHSTIYSDVGISFNESHTRFTVEHVYNCYDTSTWSTIGIDVKTDLPSNTWCRAPGATEGVPMIEHIMERIARVTGKNNLDVRMSNINSDNDKEILTSIIEELKKSSNYDERLQEIDMYNKNNRWKKRGISLVLMKYPLQFFGQYHSLVSIYARDGTVTVVTGGIEAGQGLHTKLQQIASYTLGIDLNMVSIKPSINWTSPNDYFTASSTSSDTFGYATKKACEELLDRLQPIKEMLGGDPSWTDLVMKAFQQEVDLCASHMYKKQNEVKDYIIYGATVSEVEVDALTGQHLILRVDILQDVGISLNPTIDVGQIEGAFIMGVGYWTSEELIYEPRTGGLTNYRTWNYKVPGAKDIPIDFRVSFRRNAPNPFGILRSRATGEQSLAMSCSVPIAIRYALDSARADAGNTDTWYQLDNVLTPEKILLSSLTSLDQMDLYK